MQLKNNGKGVKIGQRVGLSYCDELKIRRFYSEDNIKGNKKCNLWTLRSALLGMYCALSIFGSQKWPLLVINTGLDILFSSLNTCGFQNVQV